MKTKEERFEEAWEEYFEIEASAYEEYQKKKDFEWQEYVKIRNSAYEEYQKKKQEIENEPE